MGRNSAPEQVVELRAAFPAYTFRLMRGRDEHCIEAVRKSGPGAAGLYAVISADADEVAAELRRAALP